MNSFEVFTYQNYSYSYQYYTSTPLHNPKTQRIQDSSRQRNELKMLNTRKTEKFLRKSSEEIRNAFRTALKLQDLKNYYDIEDDLKGIFAENGRLFPKVQNVHCFGTRIMGLGNHSSGLNCFIEMKNNFNKKTMRDREIHDIIDDFSHVARKSSKFKLVKTITDARIPVCKLIHCQTRICIVVSFSDGLGVRNTKILNHIWNLQEKEAKKLALFIRNWFDTSDLTDYLVHEMLDLMVIYFLQWQTMLPSYSEVRRQAKTSVIVREVDTGYNSDLRDAADYGLDEMKDYRDYIKDFFKFYMNFNFDRYVVCPFIGKSHMVERKDLLYYKDLDEHYYDLKTLNLNRPMIVLGILKLDYNFGAHISYHRFENFKRFCEQSFDMLVDHGY